MRLFPFPVEDRSPRAIQRALQQNITLADQAMAINKLCRGTELRVRQCGSLWSVQHILYRDETRLPGGGGGCRVNDTGTRMDI